MVNPIPESVRKLWGEWNIRGVILLSLSLQVILCVFAPCRKGARSKLVIMLLWSVYLLADMAAIFALGLISNSQGDTPADNIDLSAFWTPFLILHLGGPDNITAFALEDNELWLRHFVGFPIQLVAAVYIFLLSLPKTKLAVPTILMFVPASIKYLERTRAFYLASFDRFHDSLLRDPIAFPRYGVLHQVPVQIADISRLNNLEVVNVAYRNFRTFKGIIVDIVFRFGEIYESRGFFQNISPEDAFKIIEVELNLFYEVLYTKIQVVYSRVGCINRFISFGSVVTAFLIFHFKVKKHGFEDFDVAITYTLFLGAIALDIMSLFILLSFDLTFGALNDFYSSSRFFSNIISQIPAKLSWILNLKKPRWYACNEHDDRALATPFLFGRWSGYVSGHNLLRYFFKRRPSRVHKVKNCLERGLTKVIHALGLDKFILIMASAVTKVCHISHIDKLLHSLGLINDIILSSLGLKDFVDGIRCVSHEPLTKELWEFVFNELKEKSQPLDTPGTATEISSSRDEWNLKTATKISSSRGEWILQLQYKDYWSELKRYITDVTFDESLLSWHLATELLYQTDGEDTGHYREFSKLLSDYMLYLLIIHPTMISTVTGIAKTRFQHTCDETMKFLEGKSLGANKEKEASNIFLADEFCFWRAGVNSSVLPAAIGLARRLKKLDDLKEDKWKLMSKVWVELLSYAASNSSGRSHAQQISKGGELITFVWLLMTHFGLRQQFLDKLTTEQN